jgi:hypothetical protein
MYIRRRKFHLCTKQFLTSKSTFPYIYTPLEAGLLYSLILLPNLQHSLLYGYFHYICNVYQRGRSPNYNVCVTTY